MTPAFVQGNSAASGSITTNTNVAAGSNGVDVTTFAGSGTLNVSSTTGFPGSGTVGISMTSTTIAFVSYTGTTGTTFTGCTYLGGATGNLATTDPVSQVQACAYSSNVTSGNLLVVAVGCYASDVNTFTGIRDTRGTTWTRILPQQNSGGTFGGNYTSVIFYGVAPSGGADTVTVCAGALNTNGFYRVCVHEYSGADTLDQSATAIGNSATLSSGNVTTTHASELLFAWGLSANGVTSAGSGYTLRETAGSESTEDQIVSSTGTYSATFPTTSSDWMCSLATFYSAGGGGGPPDLTIFEVN